MDAKFEDGAERALSLRAQTTEDLPIIAALVQDAVLPVTEILWDRKTRRFVSLINRFRWEDKDNAEAENRPFERVQTLLTISDVTAVCSQGVDRAEKDVILSILNMEWLPGEDGTGDLLLTLAGDGAIRVSAETLSIDLRDVTRPYKAVSGKAPAHPL
ncbi:hypothetical protein BFP70_00575 [Thioclava sp. SK-1]|uniref:DUF2948 family protein n=1 Tax=Thioclava sp. SK-1 TaxID=1889770 RepID=UPI0008271170|nr:DUF2948 family protein [Thioclava sp. SK-1]OCX66690.1 hypothetical protein BFP70_00575 [Thioclava sp. SK-1]